MTKRRLIFEEVAKLVRRDHPTWNADEIAAEAAEICEAHARTVVDEVLMVLGEHGEYRFLNPEFWSDMGKRIYKEATS